MKLESKDLRIGNLLRDKISKTELEVIELTKESIITYVINRSMFPLSDGWQIEPIPLTEEWLIKFGFNGYNNEFTREKLYGFIYWNSLHSICDYVVDGISISVYFKYVHELQNLYFALTNEELTLKT